MCFHISINTKKNIIENRFNASFKGIDSFSPSQYFNAFDYPKIPVITNDRSDTIQMFNWGLIPYWIKDACHHWYFNRSLWRCMVDNPV